MKNVLSKKVRLGRISVPVWTTGLALAVTGLAAGQAVGPVLAGSVTGTVGLTVEQAITLLDPTLGTPINILGEDDAVATSNDEGTEFTIAIELNVGQLVAADIQFFNATDVQAAAMLHLGLPAGIDVEIASIGIESAQLSGDSWLMAMGDGGHLLRVLIDPKDDLKPGFYTITGRIVQISG